MGRSQTADVSAICVMRLMKRMYIRKHYIHPDDLRSSSESRASRATASLRYKAGAAARDQIMSAPMPPSPPGRHQRPQPRHRVNFPDGAQHTLLCTFCNLGWHMYCHDPLLLKLPPTKDMRLCPTCLSAGVTLRWPRQAQKTRCHQAWPRKSHTVAPAPELADELYKHRAAVADEHVATMYSQLIHRLSMSGTGQSGTVRFRRADFAPLYLRGCTRMAHRTSMRRTPGQALHP